MLLNRIVLRNFKQFAGTQEIDLTVPRDNQRNIILIGGLNGRGKTTLLEAVRIALYGRFQNDELWKARDYDSYEDFIAESINNTFYNNGGREFSISLQFQQDSGTDLTVTRSWTYERGKWQETISVQDEDELEEDNEEIQPADWNENVRSIVPPGVAKFFFFDGEMIQSMASDDEHEQKLVQSIRDILGINLYVKLGTDLANLYEPSLRTQSEGDASALDSARARLAELQRQLRTKEAALAETRAKVEALSANADELDRRVSSVSYAAAQRVLLEKKLAGALEARRALVSSFGKVMAQEFVWLASSKLLSELRTQLQAEKGYLEAQEATATIRLKRDEFIAAVFDDFRMVPPLMNLHRDRLKERCREVWDKLFYMPERPETTIHSDLSAPIMGDLIDKAQKVASGAKESVRELLRQMATLDREAGTLAEELRLLPQSQENPEDREQLRLVREQIGTAKQQALNLQQEIAGLKNEEAPLSRTVKSLERKMPLIEAARRKLDLSIKVRDTLAEFDSEMSRKLSADVQVYIAQMFQRLSNKEELIQEFQIDPKTFSVTLLTPGGKRIPKRQLSAGEKEVYALSLVWALGQSSHVRLPIIIDTPLGRLDSQHRTKIADRYFPFAGDQVVILSTDTEVNSEIYKRMKPYLARSYTLQFNRKTRSTQVCKGYFDQ